MLFSNVIGDITIFLSPVCVQSVVRSNYCFLTDVRGLAVTALDLVYYFLSVIRFVLVFNIC